MANLAKFSKYFNIEFFSASDQQFGLQTTFVKMSPKTSFYAVNVISDYDLTMMSRNDKVAVLTSEIPMQHCFFDVAGILYLKNITGLIPLPYNAIPISDVNPEEIYGCTVNRLFGQHRGFWNERHQCYTAVLLETRLGGPPCNEIFTCMAKLMKEIPADELYQIISKAHTFFTAELEPWLKLFYALINRAFTGSRFANTNIFFDKIQWKNNPEITYECEICISPCFDTGILFKKFNATYLTPCFDTGMLQSKSITTYYISPMLICFSCFTRTTDPIRDNCGEHCNLWIPLFNNAVGVYLLFKSGNAVYLPKLVRFLLRKDTMNEKELFIAQCLLLMYASLNESDPTPSVQKLVNAVNNEHFPQKCSGLLKKLTAHSGILSTRLRKGYQLHR